MDTSSPHYLALSAQQKNEIIRSNIEQDTQPAVWPSPLQLPGLFMEKMCPTFRTAGDSMPWEEGSLFSSGHTRMKYIHSVGVVGQVELRPVQGQLYTGILAGASRGWIRLSLAQEPNQAELKTLPGMGLKFLRDGRDSANLVAMYSLSGQQSWNFFKNNFTTRIGSGPPELVPLKLKFQEATNYVTQVGLSDWGLAGEDGLVVAQPRTPFMLTFQPAANLGMQGVQQASIIAAPQGCRTSSPSRCPSCWPPACRPTRCCTACWPGPGLSPASTTTSWRGRTSTWRTSYWWAASPPAAGGTSS